MYVPTQLYINSENSVYATASTSLTNKPQAHKVGDDRDWERSIVRNAPTAKMMRRSEIRNKRVLKCKDRVEATDGM